VEVVFDPALQKAVSGFSEAAPPERHIDLFVPSLHRDLSKPQHMDSSAVEAAKWHTDWKSEVVVQRKGWSKAEAGE
jgi:hypothetical protein